MEEARSARTCEAPLAPPKSLKSLHTSSHHRAAPSCTVLHFKPVKPLISLDHGHLAKVDVEGSNPFSRSNDTLTTTPGCCPQHPGVAAFGSPAVGHQPATSCTQARLDLRPPPRGAHVAAPDRDHPGATCPFNEDDEVREASNELSPNNTIVEHRQRRGTELLSRLDASQRTVDFFDEFAAQTFSLPRSYQPAASSSSSCAN
jgi:hypothetical protein